MHPVWMHLAVKMGFTYEELNQANAFWITNKNKQKSKQTKPKKASHCTPVQFDQPVGRVVFVFV